MKQTHAPNHYKPCSVHTKLMFLLQSQYHLFCLFDRDNSGKANHQMAIPNFQIIIKMFLLPLIKGERKQEWEQERERERERDTDMGWERKRIYEL